MAVDSWRKNEKEEVKEREWGAGGGKMTSPAAADLLMGHFVLCNDTLDDVHFGQVATGEDLLLPSNSCIGYSWRNHKANFKVQDIGMLKTDNYYKVTQVLFMRIV